MQRHIYRTNQCVLNGKRIYRQRLSDTSRTVILSKKPDVAILGLMESLVLELLRLIEYNEQLTPEDR